MRGPLQVNDCRMLNSLKGEMRRKFFFAAMPIVVAALETLAEKSQYFLYIDNSFPPIYDGLNSLITINYCDGDRPTAEESKES